MEPIDHYEYWNKKRDKKLVIWDREKAALRLIGSVIKEGDKILDIGCGNGKFMNLLLTVFKNKNLQIKGIDFSPSEVKEAKSRKLDVKRANIEEGIPFKDSTFNLVYAGEIIEHLYNADFFLSEISRVLKNGGFVVFSTPNLCAWMNRVLMPLGIQPLFLEPSTKSKLVGAGFLAKFKKESQPVGHIRIFTIRALKDMLKMNQFKTLKVKGGLFDEGLPKSLLPIDRLFSIEPQLACNLIFLARKVK